MTNETNHPIYTRKKLFELLLDLEKQALTIGEDIKQLKADYTQSDDNLDGLSKESVRDVAAYAKKVANDGVEKIIDQGELFAELKDEFGG